jgi:3-mercaptopyruvate sulfurtransferase SseA
LAALGYANVRDYEGGKQDWVDAGLEVESSHDHGGRTKESSK